MVAVVDKLMSRNERFCQDRIDPGTVTRCSSYIPMCPKSMACDRHVCTVYQIHIATGSILAILGLLQVPSSFLKQCI